MSIIIDKGLFFFVDYHTATQAEMMVFVVDNTVLAGGNSLYFVLGLDAI